jgi:integrase
MPATGPGKGKLTQFIKELKGALQKGAGAASTIRNYNYAIERYKRFVRETPMMSGFKEWPANPWGLALNLREIWVEKKSISYMKTTLNAVKWGHKVEGLDNPGRAGVVQQTMNAAGIELFESINRKHVLKEKEIAGIFTECRREAEAGEIEGDCTEAMLAQQYVGIRRISEVLNTRRNYIKFITTGIKGMKIYHKGKTHGRREGEWTFYKEQTEEGFCPVAIMRRWLDKRGILYLKKGSPRWGELIYQVKGKRVTYPWMRRRMIKLFKKVGLNPKLFGTHSVRSGACTAAIARGLPRWLVKRQGGWLSEAIDIYIMPSQRESFKVGDSLAKVLNRKK